MGRHLYRSEPAFRDSVRACITEASEADSFIADAFAGAGVPRAPDNPRVARRHELILLGILQIALCDLLGELGIAPGATLAVSLGEVASAYAAGVLTRAETMSVLDVVATSVGEQIHDGRLLMVEADVEAARELCGNAPGEVDFLGTIDPSTVILYTGEDDAGENVAFIESRAVITRVHPTVWPFHTMREPYDRRRFESELAHLTPRRPGIPMYSALGAGDIAPDGTFDALHWHWMVGHPFYYAQAAAEALLSRPAAIVHIGAEPVSRPWLAPTAAHLGLPLHLLDVMRPNDEEGAWREVRSARRGLLRAARRTRSSAPTAAPDSGAPGMRTLTTYDAVRDALRRPAQFSSAILSPFDPVVLGADPPAHARGRRVLATTLQARSAEAMTSFAHETASELLAPLADVAEFDLVAEYARPLAARVAGELLGISPDRAVGSLAGAGRPGMAGDVVQSDRERFDPGGALDDHELRSVIDLASLAATVTTTQSIVATVRAALSEPERRSRIASDPALLAEFVEEVLRRDSPLHVAPRITVQAVADNGTAIPPGCPVHVSLHAANRDHRVFPDPERLVLGRQSRHLAFGAGPHRCPGARLARMEITVAVRTLLTTMPAVRVVHPDCAQRFTVTAISRHLDQLMLAPR